MRVLQVGVNVLRSCIEGIMSLLGPYEVKWVSDIKFLPSYALIGPKRMFALCKRPSGSVGKLLSYSATLTRCKSLSGTYIN